jgi:adenylosuccinate synthase
MKLDVLSGLETLKICTAYRLGGEVIEHLPARLDLLDQADPVYEELPGWSEDLAGVRSMQDLPEAARGYVDRIEEIIGAPVVMLSVGPGRDETILLRDPFD